MMKIRIVAVGKIKEAFYRDALAEYCKRLSRFADVTIVETAERRTLAEEAASLEAACRGVVLALAIEGKRMSSEAFAEELRALADRGETVTFLIGSSHGLDEGLKARADQRISFSDLTFPHQLMRVILAEQIYRAFMINAGSEYHK